MYEMSSSFLHIRKKNGLLNRVDVQHLTRLQRPCVLNAMKHRLLISKPNAATRFFFFLLTVAAL